MADHKFTLEEILNEYSEDGRRSGIRHTSDKPLVPRDAGDGKAGECGDLQPSAAAGTSRL